MRRNSDPFGNAQWEFFLVGFILLVFIISSPSILGRDEEVRVLIAGHIADISLVQSWLEPDPLTQTTVIPARSQDTQLGLSDLHRFIRLYFPRSYEELQTYGYIILPEIEVWVFTNKQQKMLHQAILEGAGGMQTRSVMSMHKAISIPWADSILSDAFPNDADKVVKTNYGLSGSMKVVINTNPNVPAIFKPYKGLPNVEYSFANYDTLLSIPKEGAVIASYSVGPYDYGYPGTYPDPRFEDKGWVPHSMYWEYGEGITWTHQDMIGRYWSTRIHPYIPDMILSELMFSTGRDLPEEVMLVHRLRNDFAQFSSKKSFINSLLDFVEKFGANSMPILKEIAEITEIKEEAERQYLEESYDLASSTMADAIRKMERLQNNAMELKNRALMWVYIIEWLAVSGVSLLSAISIWTLMVRRSLYREVEATRLSK